VINERFLSFINKHQLIQEGQRILAAVSGGIDSSVMVHLLHKTGIQFAIAHCNFGLRGEESDADELFVKKLAKKYKVPFYVQHFDTAAFAETEKVSIQMAARALRYEWFNKLLNQEGYDYIATAHHKNDLAETVLLNLTKGTGIAGFHGILPKNNKVIRPILFMEKADIYDYTAAHQLIWRDDSSNTSNKYQRNLIRNEVVPKLKEINPNFENTLSQTAEKITAIEEWFIRQVKQLEKSVVSQQEGNVFISFKEIAVQPESLVVLQEILKPYNFNYDQVKNIISVLSDEPGKIFNSPTHQLVKDREHLVISPKNLENFRSAEIAEGQQAYAGEHLKLSFEVVAAEGFKIPTDSHVACLDYALLQWPLHLRKWKDGDWFIPLGMNNKKKISDFLTDEKVPLNIKGQTQVLTSGGTIVWVVGKRIDNRFKITENTQQILVVRKK
jgi:tRNA(Ile)-lysidine synthase